MLRRIAWERVAGGIAAVVVAWAAKDVEAMWLVGIEVAILVAVVTAEAARLSEFRASLHSH